MGYVDRAIANAQADEARRVVDEGNQKRLRQCIRDGGRVYVVKSEGGTYWDGDSWRSRQADARLYLWIDIAAGAGLTDAWAGRLVRVVQRGAKRTDQALAAMAKNRDQWRDHCLAKDTELNRLRRLGWLCGNSDDQRRAIIVAALDKEREAIAAEIAEEADDDRAEAKSCAERGDYADAVTHAASADCELHWARMIRNRKGKP